MTLHRASLAIVLATLTGCGGKVAVDSPADAGSDVLPKVILATSGDMLYAVHHPTAPHLGLVKIEVVAPLKGCEDVNELAMSSAGTLYATTTTGLYTVDPSDGTCALVAMGAYPDSLAFVPPGTVDPDEEALVGYVGASYVRVDPSTGMITTIGSLGSGVVASGDLAADPIGNVFLTVEGGTVDGSSCDPCLARADSTTGALAELFYPVHPAPSGLAYADGALYGFTNSIEVMGLPTAPIEPGKPGITFFALSAPNEYHGFWGATTAP